MPPSMACRSAPGQFLSAPSQHRRDRLVSMNERERLAGWRRRLLTSVLSALVTGALVVFLPRAVGSTWHEVGDILARVSVGSLILLAVVWIAGLWAHSFVLAASLPGLTKR